VHIPRARLPASLLACVPAGRPASQRSVAASHPMCCCLHLHHLLSAPSAVCTICCFNHHGSASAHVCLLLALQLGPMLTSACPASGPRPLLCPCRSGEQASERVCMPQGLAGQHPAVGRVAAASAVEACPAPASIRNEALRGHKGHRPGAACQPLWTCMQGTAPIAKASAHQQGSKGCPSF